MPADPFVLHVARLRRLQGTRRHEVLRGSLDQSADADDFPRRAADSRVADDAEVECDLFLESFDGGVMVTGILRAPWSGVCRRCTVEVGGELALSVRERFCDEGTGEMVDEDAYSIVDDLLDLRPMIRDAILPELPLAPLCDEECKGLCVQCGTDRNQEECGCVPPIDPRWASLDVLRSNS